MSSAPKSRATEEIFAAMEDVKQHGNLPIPMKLRNAPTKLMKELGYGSGYDMRDEGDLLPEKLKGKRYFSE